MTAPRPLQQRRGELTQVYEFVCVACLAKRERRRCDGCRCIQGLVGSVTCGICVGRAMDVAAANVTVAEGEDEAAAVERAASQAERSVRGTEPKWEADGLRRRKGVGQRSRIRCVRCLESTRLAKRLQQAGLQRQRKAEHGCGTAPDPGTPNEGRVRRAFRRHLRRVREQGYSQSDVADMISSLHQSTYMRECCLRKLWRRKWRKLRACKEGYAAEQAAAMESDPDPDL